MPGPGDLPDEVLALIMSYSGIEGTKTCALVSRGFWAVTRSDAWRQLFQKYFPELPIPGHDAHERFKHAYITTQTIDSLKRFVQEAEVAREGRRSPMFLAPPPLFNTDEVIARACIRALENKLRAGSATRLTTYEIIHHFTGGRSAQKQQDDFRIEHELLQQGKGDLGKIVHRYNQYYDKDSVNAPRPTRGRSLTV